MTPLHASSPASTTSNGSTRTAPRVSSEPSDLQITLWTRLWPCTRSQAISRITVTRQIMTLRSSDKAAAKDRKWDQVKHMWERQGVGRLEWEHLGMVGVFGEDGNVEARARSLWLNGRDEGQSGYEEDGDVVFQGRGAGDVSPTSSTSTSTSTPESTNASPTTMAIPPPPPPPSSPSSLQSQHSHSTSVRHSNHSSTAADEDIFQAALTLVDAHGVDRGAAVAQSVWLVLRGHLECVHLGGKCAAACMVCRLIRAKFDRIREEFGGYASHNRGRVRGEAAETDWSTVANASNVESPARSNEGYAIGNGIRAADAGAAQVGELGVELHAGPHELDASETCSKRSTIDDASILHHAALPAAAEQGTSNISGSSSPAVVFAPPPCVSATSGYQSYQYQPAPPSRAIVFDRSLHAPDHSAITRVGRVVPISARSRSEPCLSDHPIHGRGCGNSPPDGVPPLHSPSPSLSSRGHINVSSCGSPSSTFNSNRNGSVSVTKQSPLRALARFVGDKSKQLLPSTLHISLTRPFPRSAPVSPISPPPPPQSLQTNMAPSAIGAAGRRRSSFALPFSPRPHGARGHERFASFSPLCSPRTVDAAVEADLLLREEIGNRHRDRDGQAERESVWSSVLGSSSAAAARLWARRNAGRFVGGGGDSEGGTNNKARQKSWRSAGDAAETDDNGSLGKFGPEVAGRKEDNQQTKRRHRSWTRRSSSPAARKTSPALPDGNRDGLGMNTSADAPHNHHLPSRHLNTSTSTSATCTSPSMPANPHPRPPQHRSWLPPTPHLSPVSPSAFSPASTDPPRLSLCLSLAPLPDPSVQNAHAVPLPVLPLPSVSGEGVGGVGRGRADGGRE